MKLFKEVSIKGQNMNGNGERGTEVTTGKAQGAEAGIGWSQREVSWGCNKKPCSVSDRGPRNAPELIPWGRYQQGGCP